MENQVQLYYQQPKTQTDHTTSEPWIEREVGAAVARWPLDCYPVFLFRGDDCSEVVWFNSPKEVMKATL